MRKKRARGAMVVGLAIVCAGCAPPGRAIVSTRVPGDVHCVRLELAQPGGTSTRSFDVTPGMQARWVLQNLPTGQLTVTGRAFRAQCVDVPPSASPDWLSDPQSSGLSETYVPEMEIGFSPVLPAQPFVELANTGDVLYARMQDGTVRATGWGTDNSGALGDGFLTEGAPHAVEVAGLHGVQQVVAGGAFGNGGFGCALLQDGTVQCWGSNSAGSLGDGTTTDRAVPTPVLQPPGATFARLVAGGLGVCGLTTTGDVYCWGGAAAVSVPTHVLGLSDVVDLSVSSTHACARTAASEVLCWGANAYGQFGNGTTVDSRTPTPSGFGDAIDVEVGDDYTCALRSSGGIECAGRNSQGQLGDGTTTDRATPAPVAVQPPDVRTLRTGAWEACAIDGDGTAWCWGTVVWAILGAAALTPMPTALTGPTSVEGIAPAGPTGTCVWTHSQEVWCWGFEVSLHAPAGQTGQHPTRVEL